jgi:hypothetical protein
MTPMCANDETVLRVYGGHIARVPSSPEEVLGWFVMVASDHPACNDPQPDGTGLTDNPEVGRRNCTEFSPITRTNQALRCSSCRRADYSDMRLRKLTKMQTVNDGTRSLIESIMSPEVIVALRDWVRSTRSAAARKAGGVVIGGLGLSYHCKPSYTQDIDLLFLEPAAIPHHVRGFTGTAPERFRHDRRQIEVHVAIPLSIGMPDEIAEHVIRTANRSNGILGGDRIGIGRAEPIWTTPRPG